MADFSIQECLLCDTVCMAHEEGYVVCVSCRKKLGDEECKKRMGEVIGKLYPFAGCGFEDDGSVGEHSNDRKDGE